MRAGKLKHKVTVEEPREARGETGQVTTSFQPLATTWASIEPLSGRELIAADQAQSETTIRVRMRYLAGVTNECRIVHGTRVLQIVSVIDPEDRHAELELMCREPA